MAGILIIAHAPLATALRDCVAQLYGGLPAHIGAIDVAPNCDPVDVRAHARAEIDHLKEDNGTIVLTDVFGATPSNIAASLISDYVRVFAGCNLPMLVRAVCYRSTPLDTLAEKVLQGGSKGIQEIKLDSPGSSTPNAVHGLQAEIDRSSEFPSRDEVELSETGTDSQVSKKLCLHGEPGQQPSRIPPPPNPEND